MGINLSHPYIHPYIYNLSHPYIYWIYRYKLRDFVEPPCQLDYSCEKGFKKLYEEIECRLDGAYDKKAFCVPEVF